MKRALHLLLIFLSSIKLSGQTSYKGFIDKYPIEFVTSVYIDGFADAIYTYTNVDEPIVIEGELKQGELKFYEKDRNNKSIAILSFYNFKVKDNLLTGTWKDLKSNKEMKISLTRQFTIDDNQDTTKTAIEILQPVALKHKYFKLAIAKQKEGSSARVTGVKILEKRTDKVIQQFDVDCELVALQNISVEDYNFDGLPDFAVFEQGYAGPNTSSLYFLFNPKTGKYFKSTFKGVSLAFNQKEKLITEHNQCCGGTSHMTAEYKLVNNNMVLIKKRCLQYDEKSKDYKTVKCD